MIWLASFPRSGNTFFRICYERMYQIRSFAIYPTHEQCCFPFDCDGDETCFLVKTHKYSESNNWPAIVITRDGRAALASWAHYNKQDRPYEEVLREAINGNAGDWTAFHSHWLGCPNVVAIRFEDLVAAPEETISDIPFFQELGLERSSVALPSFDELQLLSSDFFRGGDWRSDFSDELHELFWDKHGQMMGQLGYA